MAARLDERARTRRPAVPDAALRNAAARDHRDAVFGDRDRHVGDQARRGAARAGIQHLPGRARLRRHLPGRSPKSPSSSKTPITTEEFHVLNRCLDAAIAGAVTEHARITAESRSTGEIERSGQLAHEIRDLLNTALLAFHTLKRGAVAINGSTGTVLGRSLMNLRDLVDSTLSDIRMSANIARQERVPLDGVPRRDRARRQPPRRIPRAAIRDRAGRPAAVRQRRPAAAGVSGHEPLEQRLQVHARRRPRRAPGARDDDRVLSKWKMSAAASPESKDDPFSLRRSAQVRSQRPWPRTLDRPQGGQDVRRRHQLPQPARIGCIFVIDMPLAAATPAPIAAT